jgi:hypothetical protein
MVRWQHLGGLLKPRHALFSQGPDNDSNVVVIVAPREPYYVAQYRATRMR